MAVATSLYDPHCDRMVPIGISSVEVAPGGSARAATATLAINTLHISDTTLLRSQFYSFIFKIWSHFIHHLMIALR